MGIEGCLSIPEFVGDVERAEAVTIKGQNRHGQKMKLKAKGWLARIFQHETNHLDGILFTDIADQIPQSINSSGYISLPFLAISKSQSLVKS